MWQSSMIENKADKTDKTLLQIQPVHTSRDLWSRFAEDEGLSYEVLELSVAPALNESGLFEQTREWYRASGRAGSLHGNFIDVNPASGDIRYRELSRARCRDSCETALYVGAENVVFHCSCFPFLRGGYLEWWAALCAEFYEELVEQYDLNIFIENSPDIDPGPIKALMEVISNKRIGVCLDLGHVNYSHTPLAGWFDKLGDRIGYIHLSDNMGTYDDHMTLGTGTVDWAEADRLWRSLGKRTPFTLEVGNLESVKTSVDFLRSGGYFGF